MRSALLVTVLAVSGRTAVAARPAQRGTSMPVRTRGRSSFRRVAGRMQRPCSREPVGRVGGAPATPWVPPTPGVQDPVGTCGARPPSSSRPVARACAGMWRSGLDVRRGTRGDPGRGAGPGLDDPCM